LPFVTISAGSRSAFGITKTGELYASGANEHGQLGISGPGLDASTNWFTKIIHFTHKAKQVACGWAHTLVLTEEGAVFVSGDGKNGQLGLGKEAMAMQSNVFTKIDSIKEQVIQVACGLWSSFAVLASGKVLFWGRFRALKLETIYTPTVLEDMSNINKISVQHNHILTMSIDGKVSGYGCNKYNQISVKENWNVLDVFAGWNHSVLWLKSNELVLFGKNDHNQLAHSDKSCHENILTFENEEIVNVSVGSDHTMVFTNKRLLVWGWNEHGILGQNHTEQIYGAPQELNLNFDIDRIEKIICGTASCFIITK
jgi:alpha-tubulin suppressor-like RCC1 family protein